MCITAREQDLQELLTELMRSATGDPNPHVYFQPPEGYRIEYPCIVYERDRIHSTFADNRHYVHNHSYLLTVIDRMPDSPILEKVVSLPSCRHDRHFVNDNLHHDAFTLFF